MDDAMAGMAVSKWVLARTYSQHPVSCILDAAPDPHIGTYFISKLGPQVLQNHTQNIFNLTTAVSR